MKGGQASANALLPWADPAGYRVSGHVIDTNGVPVEGVLVSNGSARCRALWAAGPTAMDNM